MAAKTEEKSKDAKQDATASVAPRRKLGVILGAVAFVALGAAAAVMAVPSKPPPTPRLEGPFLARLSKDDLQVNLAGENGKRYLVLSLSAEYFAYDEKLISARLGADSEAADPLFDSRLKDTMLRLAARKTREQVEDPVQMEAFLMEVRGAVEPLLFPVSVGDAKTLQARDKVSGLRAGESVMDSTMRGLIHEHHLEVDPLRRTLRLDGGPETSYRGDERDLRVVAQDGASVFVDVTGLDPRFAGKVPIGVHGRLRRLYREQVLVQ
ncbi:MAG: flagellar basal body-associated FliL family protein [Planctomycetes bacterium]|nr:flagellar basal body-associated FliL family protein [Planctomycetota bacterium]